MEKYIAGVDEAGRGPLAGPVIAAAVILDSKKRIVGLKDSKLVTPKRRLELYEHIISRSVCFAVGRAEVDEIDSVNILQATLLAMKRAIDSLSVQPSKILIDGNRCPETTIPAVAIIKGDQTEECISAASIIAKVTRDREMMQYESMYPGYGFAKHKGYATREHYAALKRLGPSSIHRKSFALY